MRFLLITLSLLLVVFSTLIQGVEKSVCQLPKDIGPCRATKLSYFYNTETKACENFFYGGCQGNDNRFATLDECQALCA